MSSEPVQRPPGWSLISGVAGPVGWHRVHHPMGDGSVTTVCKVVGHVISDDTRVIPLCETCAGTP